MKKVTLTFIGDRSEFVAQQFYSWMVDGGLEEIIIDGLSDESVEVDGIIDYDSDNLEVALVSYFNEGYEESDDEED